MCALIEFLASFNRKERFWLLRDLIGPQCFQIGPEFRSKPENEIGRTIPDKGVWWAFDYHIDWLVAVLRTFPDQPTLEKCVDNTNGDIKGNQQDVDLIIAFENELILVEAKTAYFADAQLKKKLLRLSGLVDRDGKTTSDIRVSFVLASPPSEFRNLNASRYFPSWALKNGKPFHIDLPIFSGALMVSRCDSALKKDAKGKYWAIYKTGKAVAPVSLSNN